MSKLGALVRTGLKVNFGMVVLYHRIFREKKDRWLIPLIAFSLLGIVPMLYGFVVFIQKIYFILKPMGQESAVVALGLLAGQFVIVIFGMYSIISAFYFSRDLDMLIPLPVRPSQVLLSKFVVLLVNEYVTVACIVLPFLITFGILDGGGPGYWISATLIYLALPVIPLVAVSLIIVPMMRCINLSRKKDLLILVGGVSVLAAAFGFQFLTQRAQHQSLDQQQMIALLAAPDGLLQRIGSGFPPVIWAAKAVAGGFSAQGMANLARFLIASVLAFAALTVLAERLFYRGVIGLGESGVPRRLLTRDELARRLSSGRRAVYAIFMREFRIMNRTPVFLLNGVLIVAILPAFFILTTRTGPKPPAAELQQLLASATSLYPVLLFALFMIVCGAMNGTASSTFSREGAQFWISRVIPVSPRAQVAAKFLHSYFVAALGVVAALASVVLFFPVGPVLGILATALALLAAALLTAVGMIIDLARPLLDWTNPQKAIKQNLNVLLAIFANAGIVAAAYFGIRAMIRARFEWTVILSLLYVALILFSFLACLALCKFADRRYREIE